MDIQIKVTGLEELEKQFSKAPHLVEKYAQEALKKSLAMFETDAKRLTPVDTGYLQGSIGSAMTGYRYVRGLTAGIGTNVQYAIYVERDTRAHHNVGQAHFMEQGAKNATPFVKQQFDKAMKKLASSLTK